MLSILIATIGYLMLGVVFVMDKFILTDTKAKDPAIYTFYSTFFMVAALALLPWAPELLRGYDWFWAALSGMAFGFALWTMFEALKVGEASHISPFIGGITSVSIFVIAFFFLAERLSQLQVVGVIVMILAIFLLSFERTKLKSGIHIGFFWASVSGLFYAISHVTAKYIYDGYPFLTGFVWTRATTAIVAVLVLFCPSVWKHLRSKKLHAKPIKAKVNFKKTAAIVTVDKILAIGAVVLIQYAIAIGSVTLVGALQGLQFMFMFVLILVLTKFVPKLFKEYFTRKELLVQSFALLMVVLGYVLFIV
jgi:uncharacterized membrane protein